VTKRYLLAERTIDEKDLAVLIDWLGTNPWLTQGPLVREFERRWADWLGLGRAIFVNSGSSANLLMYYALLVSGRLRNRKVIVPAVSWATTVAPAIQLGFEPIMCDAEMTTFGLDPGHLEHLLQTHDPAAVAMVHVLGVPNDMAALLDLRARYGFLLMEDACAAMGSRYDGRLVGTFGDVSTFSFFFGHHISTIEGGMVCTPHEDLHDILLQIRSHGWPKDLPDDKEERKARERGVIDFNRPFTFYYPGFNVRSTDLNARIGLSQMDKLDWVVSRRIENHARYQARLRGLPGLHCQENDRAAICSISFAVLAASIEHRARIAQALEVAGVETRPLGGGNMSRQPYWSDRYGETDFLVADRIQAGSFQLPNHPFLSLSDVDHIAEVVRGVVA
jgi:CDP-6-deoxy-D-xylo-4-hexulose-3-dehydrase